jgi:hypothetical protein
MRKNPNQPTRDLNSAYEEYTNASPVELVVQTVCLLLVASISLYGLAVLIWRCWNE